jgi:phenylpropionate dioxygenase-like ring-hydroxylating dioxygenase large terminal subunit
LVFSRISKKKFFKEQKALKKLFLGFRVLLFEREKREKRERKREAKKLSSFFTRLYKKKTFRQNEKPFENSFLLIKMRKMRKVFCATQNAHVFFFRFVVWFDCVVLLLLGNLFLNNRKTTEEKKKKRFRHHHHHHHHEEDEERERERERGKEEEEDVLLRLFFSERVRHIGVVFVSRVDDSSK